MYLEIKSINERRSDLSFTFFFYIEINYMNKRYSLIKTTIADL